MQVSPPLHCCIATSSPCRDVNVGAQFQARTAAKESLASLAGRRKLVGHPCSVLSGCAHMAQMATRALEPHIKSPGKRCRRTDLPLDKVCWRGRAYSRSDVVPSFEELPHDLGAQKTSCARNQDRICIDGYHPQDQQHARAATRAHRSLALQLHEFHWSKFVSSQRLQSLQAASAGGRKGRRGEEQPEEGLEAAARASEAEVRGKF